ncbi:hypothetical protein BDW59DRAFT_168058 [Aspergillus cavernicola]|uniref:Uncharacterized protein n=1 Tax=Aspergillus cavernicola TaxID=176166 RepID=A0ABR4H6V4_9EURO
MSYTSSHPSSGSSDASRELRPDPACEICSGTGYYTEERTVQMSDECPNCDGTGYFATFGGIGALRVPCCSGDPDCEYCGHLGACGWYEADYCAPCGGTGTQTWEEMEIVTEQCDCFL